MNKESSNLEFKYREILELFKKHNNGKLPILNEIEEKLQKNKEK
jgi:hypothetical protein